MKSKLSIFFLVLVFVLSACISIEQAEKLRATDDSIVDVYATEFRVWIAENNYRTVYKFYDEDAVCYINNYDYTLSCIATSSDE